MEDVLGIFLTILIFYIIAVLSPRYAHIGNWSHLFKDMNHDPKEFYQHVHTLLKERDVPDFTSSIKYIKEGSIVSRQRIYLEVRRGDYAFHICAAPWGNDFFFSWWLTQYESFGERMRRRILIINALTNNKDAYYKLDSDTMFRTSVHSCVQSAIESLTSGKGMRQLSELERKPDLKSFFNDRK